MNCFMPFDTVKDKLDALLAEHSLVATWRNLDYPVRLIISPDASPEAQMSLLMVDDGGSTSPNARLCYTFELDNINVRVDGRLAVPESLMDKIKGYAKKMHYLWLQGYFAAMHDCNSNENEDSDASEDTETLSVQGQENKTDAKAFEGFY